MELTRLKLTRLKLTDPCDDSGHERMAMVDSDFVITFRTGCRELMFRCDVDVEPASENGADWLYEQSIHNRALWAEMKLDDDASGGVTVVIGACHIFHIMTGRLAPNYNLTVRLIIHGVGIVVE